MRRLGLAALIIPCVLTVSASAARETSLESAVAAAVGEHVAFLHASVRLDQDARPDEVVLVRDEAWCGSGGCVMLIFRGTSTGFKLVSRSTIVAPPIRVLSSSHKGWKDLVVHSNGTGDVVLRFGGTRYPRNPSLELAATPEQLRSAFQILGP